MRLEKLPGTMIIRGDIRCGHLWHEVQKLYEVIEAYDIHHFVEIGVHEGGLTYLLLKKFPDLHYLGIDNNITIVNPIVRNYINSLPNVELRQEDIFEVITLVGIDTWRLDRYPIIVYCDNGNKPRELYQCRVLIQSNDILMAHDYHDEKRIVKDLPHYGYTHSFPKPEVTPKDVDWIYEWFDEIDRVDLSQTRMIGFIRRG